MKRNLLSFYFYFNIMCADVFQKAIEIEIGENVPLLGDTLAIENKSVKVGK